MEYTVQTGLDTFSCYHRLSPKQKERILERITVLPQFRTIRDDYFSESYEYASDYFASKGVKLRIYRSHGSVWGLFVIVHPTLVFGEEDRSVLYQASKASYKKIVKSVDKMLVKAGVPCSLDDMALYRCDVTANLAFDDKGQVDEYIRILKKSERLPHYKLDWFREKDQKAKDCKLANQHSYKQRCRSAAFFAYDKTAQLKMIEHFPNTLIGKTVLRLEVQLRRNAMRRWMADQKLGSNWNIIRDVYKKRKEIVKWYLIRLQPECDSYVRYEDAVEMINKAYMRTKTRDRMLYLLRKTSDRESLHSALKDLQSKYRLKKSQCKTILKKFRKLGISPITLRNDSEYEKLSYILL